MLSLLGQTEKNVQIFSGPFKNSRMILNPAHSKRKILGIYEHGLNSWLTRVLPTTTVLWDVGANDGYFTYGCAHVMSQYHPQNYVIAFEPNLQNQTNLTTPSHWPCYSKTQFTFIPQFVGNKNDDCTTTLEKVYLNHPKIHHQKALIKVDVEGSEVDVLTAAHSLLNKPHQWVIEVHGQHLLAPVSRFFQQANRPFKVHSDRPHWLFGAEQRSLEISWITTEDY